jgi:hypothetical protein
VPESTSPNLHPSRRSGWRASRRTFLRALAALLGSGSGFVLPSPVTEARGRSTLWTPRAALADGYYTAPPREAAHPFNAVGALWPRGTPPPGQALEVRASTDGVGWTPWQPLPLDGDGAGQPHSTLLFVPRSHLVQYRLPAPAALPDLVFIDTHDGPTHAELGGPPSSARLLAAEQPGAPSAPAVPRPAIVTRPEWGANEAWRWWLPEYRVTHHLAVHHTGATTGGADPAAAVRSVYHYHSVVLDWGDVGYHYLVDWTGTIYEGRYGGPNVVGGHIRGHNPGVEGIAALGNYDAIWPSDSLEQALVALVAWRTEALGLDPRGTGLLDDEAVPVLLGHRDAAQTNCPGQRLYLDLGALRVDVQRRIGYVPRLAADLLTVSATRTVEVGDRWAVAVTVQNRGTIPLAAPAPGAPGDAVGRGTGYVEGAGTAPRPRVPAATLLIAMGTAEEIAAARQAAAQNTVREPRDDARGDEGPDAPRDTAAPDPAAGYPYRWTLSRSVSPGESATLSAFLRLRQVGQRRLGATLYREAGDLLAEFPPELATRVLPAPGAMRLAEVAANRLAFPWLDDDARRGQRRLAVGNPTAGPLDVRWTVATAEPRAPTVVATLPGYGAARWDDTATNLDAVNGTPWPVIAETTAPAAPQPRPPARDVPAALLEAPRGLTAALRLRAPTDGDEPAPLGQSIAYAGLADGGTRLGIPLLGEGWATEIAVQNLAERPAVAEVAWRGQAGEQVVRRQVAPGAAAIFVAPPSAAGGRVLAADNATLAGLAVATPTGGGALAYPLPSATEQTLFLPLIGQTADWTSALQLYNPGEAPIDVTLQWADYAGGGRWQDRLTLPAGATVLLPRAEGPPLPSGALGAARLAASGPVLALAVLRAANEAYLAYPGRPAAAADLVLPLADLPGLPEQRLVAVQNGGDRPAAVTLHFYDFDGRELDRLEDSVPPAGARAFRPRAATADAATVVIRGSGSPIVALLLQSPSG